MTRTEEGEIMRRSLVTIASILALVVLAFPRGAAAAVPDALGLPVHLAATSSPAPWFTTGLLAGRFGGVPVTGSFMGTSSIGILTLTVHKATFAHGSYACLRKTCTFSGLLAGVRVRGVPLPLNIRGEMTAPVRTFPTHGSWLAAVSSWAKQHLPWDQQRRIVAEAAKIRGS